MSDAVPRFQGRWPVGAALASGGRLPKAELARRMEALGGAPLFSDIPKRHLRTIARVTGVRRFPADATLMKEGTPGSSFLLILDGEARVLRKGRTVARLGPGDFLGEISLLDPGPRTATVVTTTEATCLDLAGKDFRRIVGSQPALAMRVLKGLARRFREAAGRLE